MPIFDAHLHYSHDAWKRLPPKEAVALLRKAGLKAAMVSSSSDEGTQKLYVEAPDLVRRYCGHTVRVARSALGFVTRRSCRTWRRG